MTSTSTLGSALSKIPIIKNLEPEKVMKILRALRIQPVLTVLLFIWAGTAFLYFESREQVVITLMIWITSLLIVFLFAFVFQTVYKSKHEEETKRFMEKLNLEKDKVEMANSIMEHREGMRARWISMKKEFLLHEHALHLDSIVKLIGNNEIGEAQKFPILDYLFLNIESNKEELSKLLSDMVVDYDQFILGFQKAPPVVTKSANTYIKELLDELDTITEKNEEASSDTSNLDTS